MLVNERLTNLRKAVRLTKKEVAKAIDIDQSTYGNYELGKRQPSLVVLDKIAKFYRVSTDYLLGLTDNPDKYVNKGNFSSLEAAGEYIRFKDFPEGTEDMIKGLIEEIQKDFVHIHNGVISKYDKLSDENKKIIDKQIQYLLYEQNQGQE